MERIVKQALYIDGREIKRFTQFDGHDSDLARMEDLAARIALYKQNHCRGNIGRYVATERGFKTFVLKLNLLYVIAKKLFLRRKPAVECHVVCLCVERRTPCYQDREL